MGLASKGVVATFGNFDGVHLGHQKLLRALCAQATMQGMQSLLITFSPHPVCFFNKGTSDYSIISDQDKRKLITDIGVEQINFIDFNQKFADMNAEDFIENMLFNKYKVKTIVIGPRCSFGKNRRGNVDLLCKLTSKLGIELIIIEVEGQESNYSSSFVRSLLREGNIVLVNEILGRNYSITGIVEPGEKRGRAIGFPTINLSMHGLLKPLYGVYSGKVFFEGVEQAKYGIINIGKRPTFGGTETVLLEMHIFNFDREIYGQKVKVELSSFVRREKRFNSVDDLINQINGDISVVKELTPKAF